MKKIGILGGLGWYSTSIYYKKINNYINKIRNNQINPEIVLHSVDFEKILEALEKEEWESIAELLTPKAVQIEKAGADFLVVPSNTLHRIIGEIDASINIPIINIVDVVGEKLNKSWCKRPGLLATKYTIEDGFYKNKLENFYGQEIIIPDNREIDELTDIITNELIGNDINPGSRYYINNIIDNLMFKDVDSVILGCTELSPLIDLIAAKDVRIIDSLELHIREIVYHAIRKNL
ncbi:MAG: amino acid racemase [Halanaerobiales bacterium]